MHRSGFTLTIHRDSTGGYYAIVPALPGCGSQGDTISEALQNVTDAIVVTLSVLKEDDPVRYRALTDIDVSFPESELVVDSTDPSLV